MSNVHQKRKVSWALFDDEMDAKAWYAEVKERDARDALAAVVREKERKMLELRIVAVNKGVWDAYHAGMQELELLREQLHVLRFKTKV